MPVMGGEEALKELLKISPDAAVLAMSGFDEREAKQRFGSGIIGFLQKPFTPQSTRRQDRGRATAEGGITAVALLSR